MRPNKAFTHRPPRIESPKRSSGCFSSAARFVFTIAAILGPLTSFAIRSWAQTSNADLAKEARNPIADLVNIPLENDFYLNTGENRATAYVLNIQPVIPFHLGGDWNLITRTIIPIASAPALSPGMGAVTGMGDINPTFFIAPKSNAEWIWGLGPTFTFPTASDRRLGAGEWSAGPAFGLVYSSGPWVIGGIANNQWSFAGWGNGGGNAMSLQPSATYTFNDGWYLTSGPTIAANWDSGTSNRWSLPVGGGFGKAISFDQTSFVFQLQTFYLAQRPQFDPNWQMALTLQLLFPETSTPGP